MGPHETPAPRRPSTPSTSRLSSPRTRGRTTTGKGNGAGSSTDSGGGTHRGNRPGTGAGATANANGTAMASGAINKTSQANFGRIRGVYLTHEAFLEKGDAWLRQMKSRGVNALVIDIKNDSGYVFTDSKTKMQLQHAKRLGFYTIARMVAFKDAFACRRHPDWVLMRSRNWLNPANPRVQQYDEGIARKAANLGVNEVQWDYVRYPDARYSYTQKHRAQTISRFLAYSRADLHKRNVSVSADVFGLVTTAQDDMGIGQVWENLTTSVDVLSPMIYPSHYGTGHYGLTSPVQAPYQLIRGALKDAVKRNNVLKKKGVKVATIRPWLQDFDYKASYGPKEIRAQIRACNQSGVWSYLFWNAGSTYTRGVSLR